MNCLSRTKLRLCKMRTTNGMSSGKSGLTVTAVPNVQPERRVGVLDASTFLQTCQRVNLRPLKQLLERRLFTNPI